MLATHSFNFQSFPAGGYIGVTPCRVRGRQKIISEALYPSGQATFFFISFIFIYIYIFTAFFLSLLFHKLLLYSFLSSLFRPSLFPVTLWVSLTHPLSNPMLRLYLLLEYPVFHPLSSFTTHFSILSFSLFVHSHATFSQLPFGFVLFVTLVSLYTYTYICMC